MVQLILIAAALVALIYYYGIKPMSYWKDRGVKQTSKVWFLGDVCRHVFKLESIPHMVNRLYHAFPEARYIGICQFNVPTLFIKDLDLIKQICVKDFDHFVDHRSFFPDSFETLFAKTLFSLKGESWRNMRSILTPSFSSSKMKNMFEFMSECAHNVNKYFLEKHEDIIDVDVKDAFSRYTNDVIATTAFGIKIDSLEDKTNDFYTMGKRITSFDDPLKKLRYILYFIMPKVMQIFKLIEKIFENKQLYDSEIDTDRNLIAEISCDLITYLNKIYSKNFFKIGIFEEAANQFFIKLINHNVEKRKKNNIDRQDMLHLLIEAQKQRKQIIDQDPGKNLKEITNMDIAAQAMAFFFAGFEITANTLSFMSYELAMNPDIQKILREEIKETTKVCGATITYEALSKMKYLDMVVSETFRKWSGPFVDRVCTKPYTIPPAKLNEKTLHLEKGIELMIPIYAVHHDPELYPDPEKFIPERFSEDKKNNVDSFAFLPFGIGQRSCIGNRFALLEIKVAMLHVLSNFEIIPTAKTVIPIQISKTELMVTPEGGITLGLKRLVK